MTEGTEDAETQEPSIYKDFGQKVRLVRLKGSSSCSSVLKEIICAKQRGTQTQKNTPWNACIPRAFLFCVYATTVATEMKRSGIEGPRCAPPPEGHCNNAFATKFNKKSKMGKLRLVDRRSLLFYD